jgi:hypothetical protein
VTVTVSTAAAGSGAGFASTGSDYTAKTATVTFAAGATTATFTVTIAGDRTAEPTEIFNVVLSGASGATIADGTGVVTILDNDGGARLMAAATAIGARPATHLRVATARKLLRRAAAIWSKLGAALGKLAKARVRIVDLPDGVLALTRGNRILVDGDAAGWGWYSGIGASVAAGRMDLLTVLLHELGHVLGLTHAAGGVMAEALAPGVRKRPARADLA